MLTPLRTCVLYWTVTPVFCGAHFNTLSIVGTGSLGTGLYIATVDNVTAGDGVFHQVKGRTLQDHLQQDTTCRNIMFISHL